MAGTFSLLEPTIDSPYDHHVQPPPEPRSLPEPLGGLHACLRPVRPTGGYNNMFPTSFGGGFKEEMNFATLAGVPPANPL